MKLNQEGIKSITRMAQTLSSPSVGEDQIHTSVTLQWLGCILSVSESQFLDNSNHTCNIVLFYHSCPIYCSNPCLIDSYVFFFWPEGKHIAMHSFQGYHWNTSKIFNWCIMWQFSIWMKWAHIVGGTRGFVALPHLSVNGRCSSNPIKWQKWLSGLKCCCLQRVFCSTCAQLLWHPV